MSYRLNSALCFPLFLLFVLCVISPSQAQDCDSANDCLTKGKAKDSKAVAIDYFDKALKYAKKEGINPSIFYFNRGTKYYATAGKEKNALKDFDAAIEADPNYYYAYSWKGALYQLKLKDYEAGKEWFDVVVSKFPEDPRAYYDRAHLHRYYNKMELAFPDFEQAYGLLLSNASGVANMTNDEKMNVVRWFALAYLKLNNIYVYDQNTLEILQNGANVVAPTPELLGDLAMAYYDNDNVTKAREYADQASSLDAAKSWERKSCGGEFVRGVKFYNEKNFKSAATALHVAKDNLIQPHPAIHYWFAIGIWEYYVSIFDVNPNLFEANRAQMITNLELAIKYGEGTKYQDLVESARQNLPALKK